MPDHLAEILARTRAGLPALRLRRKALESAAQRRTPERLFSRAPAGEVAVVAEIKRRSPSAGAINEELDPVELGDAYALGGAAAISVLTDGPFFGGSIDDLAAVAASCGLPVLRKDFIVDELQLVEARAAGAAGALLIVRALAQDALERLIRFAADLDLDVLVEAHDGDELGRALTAGATLIGVNARDLETFHVDAALAWRLIAAIPPDRLAVAESGIGSTADVTAAARAGADAVLVGSALAAAPDPAAATAALTGVPRRGR